MKTKKIVEEVLYPGFVAIAKSIGCSKEVEITGLFGRAPYSWYFNREFGRLKTAAVCFGIVTRPKRILGVDLLASPYEPSILNEKGIDGNCASFNLNQFQRYQLKRSIRSLLPPRILLAEDEGLEVIVSRLKAEIESLPEGFWEIHDGRLAAAGL